MARMSLSQAAQSVAGKQPVQPVPLVSEPVYPYAGTRRLSPLPPVPGSNAVRVAPAGTRLSPPPPTPGSNAYRVAPAGTLYNYAGQRDGRAMGVPYGPGAYPVINTHNPTMVVLPPRFDRFSRMQDNYNQFFNLYAPMFRQMMQQAMQSGRAAARPKGTGGPAKPKTPPAPATMPKESEFATYGQFPARWYPGMQMGPNLDRDSFGLMHPVDPYWDKFRAANPPKQGSPAPSTPSTPSAQPAPAPTPARSKPFVGGTMSYEGAYSPEPRYAYQDWKDTLKGIISTPGSPIDAAINSFFQGVKKYFQ